MSGTELAPGTVLRDKWCLERRLGRGGMSTVYAARHRNGTLGAIKVLHPELSIDPALRRRFLREGYLANKVDHPGAVQVLDDDTTEDGVVFLVMELLAGETLRDRWTRAGRKLDVELTLRVLDDVLAVLETAHARAVIHRDLKPDNIFLVSDGSTKILDFGIARLLDVAASPGADATASHAMMGTPAYMPPEQALAQWKRVDRRSDLFAVGATAFTVLTGLIVHEGSTVPELLVSASTRPPRSLRSVMPELDAGVAAAIDRALAFEMDERWPDAASMRSALQRARANPQTRTVQMKMAPPVTCTAGEATVVDHVDPHTQLVQTVASDLEVPASAAATIVKPGNATIPTPARRGRLWLALSVALAAGLIALWAALRGGH